MTEDSFTTTVIYHIDEEETPYKAKLKVACDNVTLDDFKSVLNLPRNYKYFFKSEDADFGVVKEEISDGHCRLPVLNGRIEAWLVSADGSSHSDGKGTLDAYGNRLPSRFDNRLPVYAAAQHFDQSACTSETESTISGLPRFPRRDLCGQYYDKSRMPKNRIVHGDNSSAVTSDLDTTSFLDSEDDRGTKISTCTDITSVSQKRPQQQRRPRRPRKPRSKVTAASTVTESSMSLNTMTVVLNVEQGGMLGITIVGRSLDGGPECVVIGSIYSGGAVALDGRIEEGDMLLQCNNISFENMSSDEVVRIFKQMTQKPGPIKLVVAKRWNFDPTRFGIAACRTEPVRPIDPGAWVAHTNALLQNDLPLDYQQRTLSPNRASSSNSGSFTSPIPPVDLEDCIKLDVNKDGPRTIIGEAAKKDSTLEVKDRQWLKITISNAFVGSDLVDWLLNNVSGFNDRKSARNYAQRLYKEGYIKHMVNKQTFSEQSYYVFSSLCGAFASVALTASHDECGGAHSEHDTMAPLPPPPPSINAQSPPWICSTSAAPSSYPAEPLYAPTVSMASGYAHVPFQMPQDVTTANALTPPSAALGVGCGQQHVATSDVNSSNNSSGSEHLSVKNMPVAVAPSPLAK